jgi:hypothetical protein
MFLINYKNMKKILFVVFSFFVFIGLVAGQAALADEYSFEFPDSIEEMEDWSSISEDGSTFNMDSPLMGGLGEKEDAFLGYLSGFLAVIIPLLLLMGVAIYVYISLAYMKIAKSLGVGKAWLAWIPIANLYLMSKIAQMHWWPILLLLTFFIPVINILAFLALYVFVYLWNWKMFERMNRPGWWSLAYLINGFGMIVFYVFLGMTAWPKEKKENLPVKTESLVG